jgi:hypothetical protein
MVTKRKACIFRKMLKMKNYVCTKSLHCRRLIPRKEKVMRAFTQIQVISYSFHMHANDELELQTSIWS